MAKREIAVSDQYQAQQNPRYYSAILICIYCAAVILRIARSLSAGLSGENALIGSTAEEFLRGNFPLFLLGKNHMGIYDALLSAPIIYLFGPSSYILNLWPPLFSMGVMIIMHRILKRFVGPWGVVAGLLFLAVPPSFWMFYAGYAQTHYSLGVLLSAVLILLTVRLWERPEWRVGPAFAWGVAAGAMIYTNAQTIGVFLSCVLVLLLSAWRRIRPLNLAAFFIGGVVGGLPQAYYLLTAGMSYTKQVSVFGWHYFWPHTQALFTNALPIILGFSTPETGGTVTPDSIWFIVYIVLLVSSLAGLAGLLVQGIKNAPRLSLLFPFIVIAYLAILLLSIYGDALATFHQAYLLSLYLVLPVCLGLATTWMVRFYRPLALLLAALILCVNVAGYANYMRHGRSFFASPVNQYKMDNANRQRAERLRQAGVKTLYAQNSWLLGYYTNGDPLVAHVWSARRPEDAHQIDASLDPLFYGVNLAGSAKLLGLSFKQGVVARRRSYWGFGQPDKGRLLNRASWRATALGQGGLGASLGDNDLSSGFETKGRATNGQGFILDLGAEQPVSGVALLPITHEQIPTGLKIEASVDGQHYFKLRDTSKYWGPFYMSGPHPFLRTVHIRIESYWSPHAIRYLRITHVGNSEMPWSVREVLAWGPRTGNANQPSWKNCGAELLETVQAIKPARIYADAWPAAVLRTRLDYRPWITVTQALDNTGVKALKKDEWPQINPAPGNAVVVDTHDSQAVSRALDRWGIDRRRHEAGRLVVFELLGQRLGQPIKPVAVSSATDPANAAALANAENSPAVWSSQAPQNQGASLTVDMGMERPVEWVELHNPNYFNDYPRGLSAWASDNGQEWSKVPFTLAGPLVFSGQVLLGRSGPINVYHLGKGLKTRYIKLALDTNETKWWWSVERLVLRGPAAK